MEFRCYLFFILILYINNVFAIWKNLNLRSEMTDKLNMLKYQCPKLINTKEDFDKHMDCDFKFFDMDWKNHSDIKNCKRIYDVRVPMNTINRDLLSCPHDLELAASSIPNGGVGVWTKNFIPRLTVLGPYEGRRIYNNTQDHSHGWNADLMNWRQGEAIIADENEISNWMRYINSARSYVELNLKKYIDYNGDIYHIALEDIQPYTELLVNYPRSISIPPQLFWSSLLRHNLSYNTFLCNLCNETFENPIHTKQHVKEKHYKGEISDYVYFEDHIVVQKPVRDVFGILMKKSAEIAEMFKNNNLTSDPDGGQSQCKTNCEADQNVDLISRVMRKKRYIQNKTRRTYRKRSTTVITTKNKKKISQQVNTTKIKKAKSDKKSIKTDKNTKKVSVKLSNENTSPKETTLQLVNTTTGKWDEVFKKMFTFIPHNTSQGSLNNNATVPTTTEQVHNINMDFGSSTNLEQKIRTKLLQAGLNVSGEDYKEYMRSKTTSFYEAVWKENCQSDSESKMEPGELADFIEKLKILKTYGTLNVSDDLKVDAIKNFKTETGVTADLQTIKFDDLIKTYADKVEITSKLPTTTKLPKTTVKPLKTKKGTKHICNCPTYSDYRWVVHNITIDSNAPSVAFEDQKIEVVNRYSYSESVELNSNKTTKINLTTNITQHTTTEKLKIKGNKKDKIIIKTKIYSNKNQTNKLRKKLKSLRNSIKSNHEKVRASQTKKT